MKPFTENAFATQIPEVWWLPAEAAHDLFKIPTMIMPDRYRKTQCRTSEQEESKAL
jgi:hypothetical protein